MTLSQYLQNINQRYKLGNATEHTFRGDLQQLIESLMPEIRATNEPKRQSCGAPDYILTKKDIPIGFIEAKDIGDKDLEGSKKTGNKEQFDRYKASLNNIIFTDYLDFHLYRDGQFITKIAIAELAPLSRGEGLGVRSLPENFPTFENLIKDFCTHISQTIKSPKKLAEMMAGKACLLAEVIEKALNSDEDKQENSTLKDQMTAFKQILIHDITPKGFADVYAQTIAYGMFAARYHDPTLPTFSREEAATLIPKSNPFLRKLFGYIAGPDLDDRIKWIVDSLVEIFLATDVAEILTNFGKSTKTEDPIIHFYETFLSAYDPKLRKARGVWYTPHPVVSFIIRAIDYILKIEFGIKNGIADNSMTTINVDVPGAKKPVEQQVHKVQFLDPATGSGTFITELVLQIYKMFEGQQGIWSSYVENHLIPRINGFEILMASYAMAHLKLDLLLKGTGYKPTKDQRFKIYLTNSLEEFHHDTGTLFANWLSNEASEANFIKKNTPVMVVMGNPPYSVSSSNKSKWIENLTEDYKKDLNERNIQPLSDDYIKFIRFGQHFIDKNGVGILAYISNNSFIDGIIHRQMRRHLLESFDKIYILDLHGNAKKKELCPDGSPDQNVFDIMQGVSINIFVKTGKKKKNELGKVFHFDLQGKREFKYDFLNEKTLQTFHWNKLETVSPNFYFVKKDFYGIKEYNKGLKIDELFLSYNNGIETGKDNFFYALSKKELAIKLQLAFSNKREAISKFEITNTDSFRFLDKFSNSNFNEDNIRQINYRPFDISSCYYDKVLQRRPAYTTMRNLFEKNLGLLVPRQVTDNFKHVFVSKYPTDSNLTSTAKKFGSAPLFPLYLYPETKAQQTTQTSLNLSNASFSPPLEGSGEVAEIRTPNLNPEIVKQIAEKLGLTFVNEKTPPNLPKGEAFSPSFGGFGEVRERIDRPGYITANPAHYKLIKEMRDELKDNPTEAEKLMWEYLRNKKTGHKIRRQHIIDDFITDFVCLRKKVVIEIDGKIHLKQKEYDELRTEQLNELGYEVIRFKNEEVFGNPESVTLKIKEYLDAKIDSQTDEGAETTSPPSEGPGEVLEEPGEVFAPIDILDYIYAVLHSPTYREKYKEFLKIDFPRVPYPKDAATFWQLVKLGGEIRQIHLLESPVVEKYITQYPIDGDNIVRKISYVSSPLGRLGGVVYINETQYFSNVSEIAWNFYIGGYQPAQKWLKDRKDRKLEFEDISHYQKIIVALSETDRIMKEIDKIEIE